jgi:hypothetical protein
MDSDFRRLGKRPCACADQAKSGWVITLRMVELLEAAGILNVPIKGERPPAGWADGLGLFFLVAGTGFEPVTFRL